WAEAAAIYVSLREKGQPVTGITGAARRVLAKIRRLLAAIRGDVNDLGFSKADQIFEAFSRGELAGRREALPAEMRERWWRHGQPSPAASLEKVESDKLRHWRGHVARIMAGTATAEYDVLQKAPPPLASMGVKGRVILRPTVAKAINERHSDLPRVVWDD